MPEDQKPNSGVVVGSVGPDNALAAGATQPFGGGIPPAAGQPASSPTTAYTAGSQPSLAKVTEAVLFGLAIVVIAAVVFGWNGIGMVGMAGFFLYGFVLMAYSLGRAIFVRYQTKQVVMASILLGTAIIGLPILAYACLIAFWIVTLMLGFWEINS